MIHRKYVIHTLCITAALLSCGCQTLIFNSMGYSPEVLAELTATPEEGVELEPMAAVVLDMLIKSMGDDFTISEPPQDEPDIHRIAVGLVENREVSGSGRTIPVRLYYPRGIGGPDAAARSRGKRGLPVIAFYHGGGFRTGSLNTHDRLCRLLANETRSVVVATEYRLAPEHPFPAGVEDCYAALTWIADSAVDLGVDADAVFTAGDSAGGNLAAVMAVRSGREYGPTIRGHILYYASTTFFGDEFPSRGLYGGRYGNQTLLPEELMQNLSDEYLVDPSNAKNPYASPLLAEIGPDFPPALVVTAQCDPLRDEGRAYYKKLVDSNVDARYYEAQGMVHGFISFDALFPEARRAVRDTARFIRDLSK